MTHSEGSGGPDGLHRAHAMLAAAYGVEVPLADYPALVVVFGRQGASDRAIVELMRRFTSVPDGTLINNVPVLAGGGIPVPGADVARVEQRLDAHKDESALPSPASPAWEQREKPDGPDGLHRLHAMLAATYGVEVPAGDYASVVLLIHRLGLSSRGIVELLRRFTSRGEGGLSDDVNRILGKSLLVADADVSRVQKRLEPHGYESLRRAVPLEWKREVKPLELLDPRVPEAARRYWERLIAVFPEGLQDLKEYVTLLALLSDENVPRADLEPLMAALRRRPRELVARDLDALGTVLVASEADKAALRRKVGLP